MTQKITVIGVGLIGGSFGLALKEARHTCHIVGAGRSQSSLERAAERGIVDSWHTSLIDAVAEADVVLLATPVGAIDSVLAEIAPAVGANTVVTDAGSVKQSVIESARKWLPHFGNFVPAHPIAGTEHSGVEAGFSSLYTNKRLILTPVDETLDTALQTVSSLWTATGAKLETMDPKSHDQIFAATSHLPHVLAFSLVETLYRMDQYAPILRNTGGGFADYTRIASSDPVMWRDVCLYNRDALLESLSQFQAGLSGIVEAIEKQDAQTLQQLFEVAKRTRDSKVLPAESQLSSKVNHKGAKE